MEQAAALGGAELKELRKELEEAEGRVGARMVQVEALMVEAQTAAAAAEMEQRVEVRVQSAFHSAVRCPTLTLAASRPGGGREGNSRDRCGGEGGGGAGEERQGGGGHGAAGRCDAGLAVQS